MKILVTGASGFAGTHVIEALQAAGHTDIRGSSYGDPGYLAKLLPEDRIEKINLTNKDAVFALLKKLQPDWIFHLASFAFVGESFTRGAELLQNNLILQQNMLDGMKAESPKARMLAIGSAEEYGYACRDYDTVSEDAPLKPVNPYAVSKVAQDMLAYAYYISLGLDIVRARPFNHIGERQTDAFAIPAFVTQVLEVKQGKRQTLEFGNLDTVRDLTDVKDMVRAYILLMEKGVAGEVYNIGSGTGVSMQKVVEMLMEFAGVKAEIARDPSRMRPLDIPRMVADASKIRVLGWEPKIPLEETLKRVLE